MTTAEMERLEACPEGRIPVLTRNELRGIIDVCMKRSWLMPWTRKRIYEVIEEVEYLRVGAWWSIASPPTGIGCPIGNVRIRQGKRPYPRDRSAQRRFGGRFDDLMYDYLFLRGIRPQPPTIIKII